MVSAEERALLAELARSPERLPLVRALHERLSMPMDKARGLHNMGQASVNLSHNPAWFHRKAIQEFRVQLTCTKESTMLLKGT